MRCHSHRTTAVGSADSAASGNPAVLSGTAGGGSVGSDGYRLARTIPTA